MLRNNRGITLIALVVTVIVLIILTSITLGLVLGNNGIIRNANKAKNSTELADIKEQIQRDFIRKERDVAQDRTEIVEEDVLQILRKKGEILNQNKEIYDENNEDDEIWGVRTPKGELALSDLWSGGLPKKQKTVVILQPGDYVNYLPGMGSNTNNGEYTMTIAETGGRSNQLYNTTDYKGNWQVLYDYTTYGRIEIISSDSVASLELGGQDGYNKMVSTLNIISKKYINSQFAISARSVGSDPSNSEGETNYYSNSYSYFSSSNGTMISPDTTYTTDVAAMQTAGVKILSGLYWMTSRYVIANESQTYFEARYMTAGGGISSQWLRWKGTGGTASTTYKTCGVRPVITLKSHLIIVNSGETKNGKIIWNLILD